MLLSFELDEGRVKRICANRGLRATRQFAIMYIPDSMMDRLVKGTDFPGTTY